MTRLFAIALGAVRLHLFLLTFVWAGSVLAQDVPDPVVTNLRQLSGQVKELRALSTKSLVSQQGIGSDIKQRLASIEKSCAQLESSVLAIDRRFQEQLNDLQALNSTMWVVIGVLATVVFLMLSRMGLRRTAREPFVKCDNGTNIPASTAENFSTRAIVPADAPSRPAPVATSDSAQVVVPDLQSAEIALSEARISFMKPVNING